MPEPPLQRPADPVKAQRGSWISIPIALLMMLAGVALLLSLPMGFIGIAVIVGAVVFSLVIGFHYFVWGWWLGKVLEQDGSSEDQDSPELG